MLKIGKIIICMCFILSETCYAINFSQPVKIGTMDFKQDGGVYISGAIYNKVQFFPENRRTFVKDDTFGDEKGIACFGKNTDDLYIYYNTEKCLNIGGNTLNNTISRNILDCVIYQIKYDRNDSVYSIYDMNTDYIIIARKINSYSRDFVKYIDTKEITKRYFGENSHVIYKNLFTQGDTIIMDYYFSGIEGRFIFKWDDNAQWFSVDRTVDNVRSGY